MDTSSIETIGKDIKWKIFRDQALIYVDSIMLPENYTSKNYVPFGFITVMTLEGDLYKFPITHSIDKSNFNQALNDYRQLENCELFIINDQLLRRGIKKIAGKIMPQFSFYIATKGYNKIWFTKNNCSAEEKVKYRLHNQYKYEF